MREMILGQERSFLTRKDTSGTPAASAYAGVLELWDKDAGRSDSPTAGEYLDAIKWGIEHKESVKDLNLKECIDWLELQIALTECVYFNEGVIDGNL